MAAMATFDLLRGHPPDVATSVRCGLPVMVHAFHPLLLTKVCWKSGVLISILRFQLLLYILSAFFTLTIDFRDTAYFL